MLAEAYGIRPGAEIDGVAAGDAIRVTPAARICTAVVSLIDVTMLAYRVKPRFPATQRRATEILRRGIDADDIRVPHQAVVEFFAAVTWPLQDGRPLLGAVDAIAETEAMLTRFTIVYPDANVVRTALRGMAAYRLSWFDAHRWASADTLGMETIFSEDFQEGRCDGTVRFVNNPFRE